MKKIGLSLLTIIMTIVFANPLLAQIKGNGEITKQLYDVEDFDAIVVSGARNVILSQGDEFKVEVETDSNIHDYIKLSVTNGKLSFGFNTEKIKKYKELNFYITAPEYKSIKASGASDVSSNETITGDDLKIICSGASDIDLIVDYNIISSDISGASDVNLSGKVMTNTLESSGASEFHGKNLVANSSVVNASGASICFVNAKANLTYKVSGASSVKYVSTPETVIVKKGNDSQKVIVNSSATLNYYDSDTTKVKLGKLNVEVVDGDTTIITVGRHTLAVSEDGNLNWEKCKRNRFNGNWGGVDIGLNGYLTSDFDMNFDPADDYLSLRMEKSINLNMNIYEQNISLNKEKNMGIITGLGLSWNNYRFSKSTYLTSDSSNIMGYYMDGVSVRKTKLTVMYISVPLFFEIQSKHQYRVSQFHFAVGAIVSARVSTHTKVYFNESNKEYDLLDPVNGNVVATSKTPSGGSRNIEKDFNSYHLSPFKFDVSVRFGYGIINLYATYSLNTMFTKDHGPELYPFSAGITLVGW
jgi:putative autotransporter adhesin-like protein